MLILARAGGGRLHLVELVVRKSWPRAQALDDGIAGTSIDTLQMHGRSVKVGTLPMECCVSFGAINRTRVHSLYNMLRMLIGAPCPKTGRR